MRQVQVGTMVAAAGGYAALYRLGQTWGATDHERRQALAGDELLPFARARTTHAITIAAPAVAVWPWPVPMGWGRAGWYTYRWVDRLLVLRSTRHLPASWRERGLAVGWIWSWQLDEPVPERTRVIQRNRMRLEPAWFERAFLAAIVPADFIMARSHLRGLRRRVQGSGSSAVRNRRISRTAGR
jgi:hypothetical protein